MSDSFVPLSDGRDNSTPPPGWHWHRLLDLARLETGHTPSRNHPEWWKGDIPWIALPDIRRLDCREAQVTLECTNTDGLANSSARLLPPGTVCLSRTASVGFVTILGRAMATSQDFVNWVCGPDLDPWFLLWAIRASRTFIRAQSSGAIHKTVYLPVAQSFEICAPPIEEQRRIAKRLRAQFASIEAAQTAAEAQEKSLDALLLTAARQTLAVRSVATRPIGEALHEVTKGVGENWADFPIYGATRDGLALAKEPAGKTPWRYKPVVPSTIFYNPMRILIGSIAIVADDVPPGITSPDYVVLRTVPEVMEPLWFYEWLRSFLGAQFILTLARGAVRERLLFKRLAQGSIPVPPLDAQRRFCSIAREIRTTQSGIAKQLAAINRLPAAYLRETFSGAL